jgi:hypothetical protein
MSRRIIRSVAALKSLSVVATAAPYGDANSTDRAWAKELPMRVLLMILAMLVFVATAQAQAQRSGGTGGVRGPDPAVEARKRRDAEEIDRAYKAAIGQVPAAQKSDPWGNIRDVDQAKKKK